MGRVARTLDYRLAGMEPTNKALAAVLSPWFVLSSLQRRQSRFCLWRRLSTDRYHHVIFFASKK